MASVSVAELKFRETVSGRYFQSLRDLEDVIKEFSQATGYYYKARSSHKYPLSSPHAEKFVYVSRKYVCVMAPTKNRVGCESFFNVVHRKKDGIIVTSFNMDHSHDSLPPEKVDTEEVFKEHGLQDFRTLSPSSPKTQEQALVLRAQFKRLMQNGIFNSYADLMSTIRKYEKAANSNFRISHSSRLPQDHPAYSRVKYRYIYFACIHGGKCRGENMIRRTKSKRSGCKARFTAVKVGSQLHVKSVYMLHNHICNRMLASTYPRFRRSQCETNRGPTKMITRIRPSASRLPYLRSSFETDCKMEDLSNICRRILPSDPSTMRMTEALHKMRGGCLPDFLYGEEGLEAMCFTTPALKTVFAQYAKVVQMDGTYRTNRHGFALYHIVITDKHGHAQSVFYAFILRETAETIEWIIRKFREVMGSATKEIRTIFIDKNARELRAFRRIFPEIEISVLLCTSNVIQAFRRKITKLYLKEKADSAMHFVKKAVTTVSRATYKSVMKHIETNFPELWSYVQENWLSCERMWAHHARARVITYGDDTTNKTESINRVLKQWCRGNMCLTDSVTGLATFLQSEQVDSASLETEEYCNHRQYTDCPKHVAAICQRLTAYASDVLLKHLNINKGVESSSERVDVCSCRFFSNWELPCVHIVNCVAAKGVDPQVALKGCRWLTIGEVLEDPETSENPDLQPVTSFLSDVVLPPFTETYRYREAMKRIDPILEKLKNCGRRRFDELLRKLDAFVDEIANGTPTDSHDQSPPYSVKAEGDKWGVGEGSVASRFVVRSGDNMLRAQAGAGHEQPVLRLHNDRLLPIFPISSRPRQAADDTTVCDQGSFI